MRRPLALLTAALALGAVTAAPASAGGRSDDIKSIDGGATTLALDAAVGEALAAATVAVAPIAPAGASPAGIAFPITGGELNDDTGAGTLRHAGGLRISSGEKAVALTDFRVDVDDRPELTAEVGGARIPILRLDLGAAKVAETAIGVRITGVGAVLKGNAARALNAALGTTVFSPNLRLGTVTVDARKAQILFEGGTTSLALDPAAGAALASLGVRVSLGAPATANPDGSLAFRITGGALRTSDLAGEITHAGVLYLRAGGKELRLSRFTIDTVRGVLTAKANRGARVDFLKLDLSAPQVGVFGGDDEDGITVGNVPASLTATAAAALNATFGVTAFTEGLRLGVATVRGEAV